jgi:hypothetical protein
MFNYPSGRKHMFHTNRTIQSLVVASGLAVTSGAQAFMFVQSPSPVLIAASQTVTLFTGFASGSLTLFTYTFGYDEPITDSSWASDMRIDITDPNNTTVSIAGLDTPGLVPTYNGPISDPAGKYGDKFDLSSFGLAGTGIWTITFTNDWSGDPNPNEIGGGIGGTNPFIGTLDGVVLPAPGAIGFFGVAGIAAFRRRR